MLKSTSQRLVLSCLLIVLALLSVSGILDEKGDQYTQQGFKRALITFAVARGLNGVISVAQETEVSLQPAGVGVTILPGQILDPVNDLIERFSWVMLASSTSLGLQKLFSSIVSWPIFSYLLLLWVAIVVALIWWPKYSSAGWKKSFIKLTAVFFIIRFLVPVIAISSETVYSMFLEQRYETSLQALKTAKEEVSETQNVAEDLSALAESSFLDKAKRFYQSAKDGVNVRQRMQALGDIAAKTTEHAIELIVIFIFQTILFPLLFLWLLIRVSKKLLT